MISFIKTNLWLVVVTLAVFVAFYLMVDPAPPREITIATGSENGRYYELGKRIARKLSEEGVTLHIKQTRGAVDNMTLLNSEDSEVAIAFVQSGMKEIYGREEDTLRSLGSLYYEPIWLFYRKDLELDILPDLEGLKVAVGAKGSGTNAVSGFLLRENGLSRSSIEALQLEEEEAIEQLVANDIDAAFFMVPVVSDAIDKLIHEESLSFMDMRRYESYEARYPFLTSVKVSEGLLDLKENIPNKSQQALASSATLLVNDRFHPSLTPVVMEALTSVLKDGSLLEKHGEFPSPQFVDYPLTKEADHYFEFGPPFLLRYMPFWAASLVDRFIIFLIPLLVVIIPLSKTAGPVYRWRVRSRIYKWYKYLRETDKKIVAGTISQDIDKELDRIEKLEEELASVDVPLSYTDELYHLREHVAFVAKRLRQMKGLNKG
ncbi:TAXI family TRAP transporter solute-binding subunit [Puniceicoccaceae bacterium K14]|nr:TAXI family TRAP transporter solute-binding subunit [Puniceicoccaceae bacterium K14]